MMEMVMSVSNQPSASAALTTSKCSRHLSFPLHHTPLVLWVDKGNSNPIDSLFHCKILSLFISSASTMRKERHNEVLRVAETENENNDSGAQFFRIPVQVLFCNTTLLSHHACTHSPKLFSESLCGYTRTPSSPRSQYRGLFWTHCCL